MFRTSKCSSSGRLAHTVLYYCFQASNISSLVGGRMSCVFHVNLCWVVTIPDRFHVLTSTCNHFCNYTYKLAERGFYLFYSDWLLPLTKYHVLTSTCNNFCNYSYELAEEDFISFTLIACFLLQNITYSRAPVITFAIMRMNWLKRVFSCLLWLLTLPEYLSVSHVAVNNGWRKRPLHRST